MTERQKRYEQRAKQRKARRRFYLYSFISILVLAGIITLFIELIGGGEEANSKPTVAESQLEEASSTAEQVGSEQTGSEQADSETPQTTQTPTEQGAQQTAGGPFNSDEATYTKPTAQMTTLPKNGVVDISYFSDAVFVGDNFTAGLKLYTTGIQNAQYATFYGVEPVDLTGDNKLTNASGQSVSAKEEILSFGAKKVYLLAGPECLGTQEDEEFLQQYEQLIDELMAVLPADTVIYVQAVPPVTQSVAVNDDSENENERIAQINDELAFIAYTKGCCFLDISEVLKDENGNLKQEYSQGSEGIYLNESGYSVWRQYLMEHTLYGS